MCILKVCSLKNTSPQQPHSRTAPLSVTSCSPWCNQLCTHCCNQSSDCPLTDAQSYHNNFTLCQIYCDPNRSRSDGITIKMIPTNNLRVCAPESSSLHQRLVRSFHPHTRNIFSDFTRIVLCTPESPGSVYAQQNHEELQCSPWLFS